MGICDKKQKQSQGNNEMTVATSICHLFLDNELGGLCKCRALEEAEQVLLRRTSYLPQMIARWMALFPRLFLTRQDH